jgi:hypothetical protein
VGDGGRRVDAKTCGRGGCRQRLSVANKKHGKR